jgi:hypothetical protein
MMRGTHLLGGPYGDGRLQNTSHNICRGLFLLAIHISNLPTRMKLCGNGTAKTRRGHRAGEGGRNAATKEREMRRQGRGQCDGGAGGCDQEEGGKDADGDPGVIHHDKGYTSRPKNDPASAAQWRRAGPTTNDDRTKIMMATMAMATMMSGRCSEGDDRRGRVEPNYKVGQRRCFFMY